MVSPEDKKTIEIFMQMLGFSYPIDWNEVVKAVFSMVDEANIEGPKKPALTLIKGEKE